MSPSPRIGVGVFILNAKDEFLLGERIGSIGAETWAPPGGHLEFGETFEECAIRETKEETGLDIEDVRFLTAVNTINLADHKTGEPRHYIAIFVTCTAKEGQGEPKVSRACLLQRS